ncbi:MAG: hypothetical protein MEQ84_11730 [Mesorhizobium sp.]|nr:hypothetical protein [Mesorhizobium sp.]
MANFTSINSSDPTTSAIDAFSVGEGIQIESTASHVAAVAAYQKAAGPGTFGAAVFAVTDGDGAGIHTEAKGKGDALMVRQTAQDSTGAGVSAVVVGHGHAIFAKVDNPNGDGMALWAEHTGGPSHTVAQFNGSVTVTGDIALHGMDCAEEFVVINSRAAEPGTLMIIGTDGVLEPSNTAYDRKVVGVVAGASDLRPGLVLGKGQHSDAACCPIALIGRTWCKVDASYGAIGIGDLLTSSDTPGHAMIAANPGRAFGAVIGKAMAPHVNGSGLIPILIALQ